jgi:hypothetical protein
VIDNPPRLIGGVLFEGFVEVRLLGAAAERD